MLGMHGTYEANLAMYHCDVMINIGARFDDRITGKLTEFSPKSKKIHVDIDPSSINKNVRVDLAVVGDAGHVLEDMIRMWKAAAAQGRPQGAEGVVGRDRQVAGAQLSRLQAGQGDDQAAIRAGAPLSRDIKDRDHYITTEVGQHQMWAAQFLKFEEPNRWMTSRAGSAPWATASRRRWACRSPIPMRWSSTSPARPRS